MRLFTRQTFVFCLAVALVIIPVMSSYAVAADTAAAAEGQDGATPGAMGLDLVGVRPLGIATTVLGFAAFVVSIPFSLPGGNTGDVWEKCVKRPAKYTFVRPLGEF